MWQASVDAPLATAVVALAAAAADLFLTVWRPHFEPSTQQAPRIAVPYTTVQYTVGDARRAFPKTCTTGLPDAARWHANVRVVVGCANAEHAHLLTVGTRALAKL